MQVHSCRKRDDYSALVNGPILTPRWMLEQHLANRHRGAVSFTVPGFCAPCGQAVDFTADFAGAWHAPDGLVVPNWRECLRCPQCGLSGRQRRVAELVSDALVVCREGDPCVLYMMEALSPLFGWVRQRFPWVQLIGSEFLGDGLPGGSERQCRPGRQLRRLRARQPTATGLWRSGARAPAAWARDTDVPGSAGMPAFTTPITNSAEQLEARSD